jgi:hypothetical protein
MQKYQTLLTATMSSVVTLMLFVLSLVVFSWTATAAPVTQNDPNALTYQTISGLAFIPVNYNATYTKDITRQLLSLMGQVRPMDANKLFITPLNLADKSLLVGMTAFGQDADNQGEIRLRLKRCDNGQARCTVLAETSSTNVYALGLFETARLTSINERVDNYLYSYFLEAEITAIYDSGLRAVRLELVPADKVTMTTTSAVQPWSLDGTNLVFAIPMSKFAQVRVCAGDFSQLNNPTHYPILVVDGQIIPLESQACVVVWGGKLELRRNLNTGPSSGTYEFLR